MIEINNELRDIVISALRYSLYRHTYVLSQTIDFIINNQRMFDDRMINVILHDIKERLEDNDLKDFERKDILRLKQLLEETD